jgi:hypothetical protein
MEKSEEKKIEIIDVNIDFNLDAESAKIEQKMFDEVANILKQKEVIEESKKDIIDEIVELLKTKVLTRDDISEMTGATASKLSGITNKLKARLGKNQLKLVVESKSNKRIYKIEGIKYE